MKTRLPALPLVAAGFMAGCFASMVDGPAAALLIAAALVSAAAWLALPGLAGVMSLIAALACFGAGLVLVPPPPGPGPLAGLAGAGTSHLVVGIVRTDAVINGTTARVDLDVESVDGQRGAWGAMRVTLPAPSDLPQRGDRVQATLEPEAAPAVPDFDYAAYLRTRGIDATAAYPASWATIDRGVGNDAIEALDRLRGWLTTNIERALPEPGASLAAGMLLGERRTMPADLSEALRETGTSHLVVMSGQNIALVLGSASVVLGRLLPRRRAALATLLILPAYVALAGADAPVIRAAIMAVGMVIAGALGRRTPGWIYLTYAGALMLAADPGLARDVSFQLSLAATSGVVILAPPLRDTTIAILRLRGARAAVAAELLAVTLAATLTVLPVQLAVFGSLPLAQVPANLAVAPLYGATLVVALAAALLGWSPLGEVIGLAGASVPEVFAALVMWFARVPAVEVGPPPALFALGWLALLSGAAWWLGRSPPAILAPGARSPLGPAPALAVVAAGLWLAVLTPPDGMARVTVLDVGQGLAVLIEDAGHAVLVDAGPPDGAAVRALHRIEAPRTLDAIVLTHPDADHAGGLSAVTQRFDVGAVLRGVDGDSQPIDIGDRIVLGDRTRIEVLGPPVQTGTALDSDNDRSLVLLVTIGDRRVLLTGDIEEPAEAWLVRSGQPLTADVLVAPHHGSRSSSSEPFLAAVDPAVVVISAGAENRYGHPHPGVIEHYEAHDITVVRTDQAGDVSLRSDGASLWLADD